MAETNLSGNTSEDLQLVLENMKRAQVKEGAPSLEIRIDRLDRAIKLLVENSQALAEAVCADFGNRSIDQTLLADVGAAVSALKHCRSNLERWMQNAIFPAGFPGVQNHVEYQPLGVVGIVSPWNFPVILSFGPLAGILSAGNRAMLKPSELTPRTSLLISKLMAEHFHQDEVFVVLGDQAVAQNFSALPFDHLIFTGSTSVGKHVMRAAAENLVPLTLELGGKSPVIISQTASLDAAAQRIMTVKTFNAGQICLAPDYVFVPENLLARFVDAVVYTVKKMYPSIAENPDYTSIINGRNFSRLQNYLHDARQKGADIIPIRPEEEPLDDPELRKIAPTLILNTTDDMLVMQEEIFGPILPICTYRDFAEVINHINQNPRPLAAYYFGQSEVEQQVVLKQTTSGAVVVNDVMTHVMVDDLPFGGIGYSGMGAYHGNAGFRTFSHAKSVLIQSAGGESNIPMRAPYGKLARDVISHLLTR